MYATADFKKGLQILFNGEPHEIVEFQHHKTGRGGAMVRTKMRNLRSGLTVENTFRAGEKLEPAELERRTMQYLYRSGDMYLFMDTTSYEQIELSADVVGQASRWLTDGMEVVVIMSGDEVIGVQVPFFIPLRVIETVPGIKGDTVSAGSKPATLETGAVVQVPLFVDAGEVIRVDTRTGSYMERVR